MKKTLLAIMCLAAGSVFAQKHSLDPSIRFNTFALYAADDRVDSYYSSSSYYRGKIKGGFEWGGGLEVMVAPDYGVELSYLRLDSSAPIEYYKQGIQFTNFDLASNYLFLGGNRYLHTDSIFEPYGGLQLGMAILNLTNPDNGRSDSATKFAWGLKLGTNIWATHNVGFKLQASLLSIVDGFGGGLYFGSGGGGVGINTYSSTLQFNVGGGLTFNFGD